MLGLGGVGDLPADPAEAEDAQRPALVAVPEEVELAALEEQVVGVDLPRPGLVPLHRVVVEGDRLVAEDRRLDLRQAARELVPARAAGDPERDGALVGRVERRGPPPGDLLERHAQRLGVGELPVEQRERRLQGRQLAVGERDRGEVEVLGPQGVVLLLGDPVDGLLDGQGDPEGVELGPVRVEAPRERVLVHPAVALDVPPDLQGGDRTALGHQVGDQRELADELLRVLRHGRDLRAAPVAGRRPVRGTCRSLRPLCAVRAPGATNVHVPCAPEPGGLCRRPVPVGSGL